MADVTCIGVLVADVIVHPVDTWPQRGQLTVVDEIELHSGGLAHTTSMTLAKLGVPTATVGRVGADPFGTFLIDALRDHGIEDHILRDGTAATSTTVVIVASNGERSFLHLVGANGHLVPDDVPAALLPSTKVVHLGGYFIMPGIDGPPAARLLQQAKRAGCRTSVDVAWDPHDRWMTALRPCLPHLDLFFGNQDEVARITGTRDPHEAAAQLRAAGVGLVAVKMGEAGAYVEGADWRGLVPTFEVDVVDTTGAGDAFCGGFLAASLAGWDLHQTTRFANAVGALCVTAVGGTTGVRGMHETLQFMRSARVRKPIASP
jgi:sugar/nucleoside kinase (ribokinase family)